LEERPLNVHIHLWFLQTSRTGNEATVIRDISTILLHEWGLHACHGKTRTEIYFSITYYKPCYTISVWLHIKLTSLLFIVSLPTLGRSDSKINMNSLHANQLEMKTPSARLQNVFYGT
jgi:hypothetical protein